MALPMDRGAGAVTAILTITTLCGDGGKIQLMTGTLGSSRGAEAGRSCARVVCTVEIKLRFLFAQGPHTQCTADGGKASFFNLKVFTLVY
ncbi:hypothetical protein [Halioxenophilus aromaticivorans]|uniref:hypothetical protein n=1 Tax=Halioxenophilus aromaticivorans TaxID=1306992 RepID=UPI0031F161F5